MVLVSHLMKMETEKKELLRKSVAELQMLTFSQHCLLMQSLSLHLSNNHLLLEDVLGVSKDQTVGTSMKRLMKLLLLVRQL